MTDMEMSRSDFISALKASAAFTAAVGLDPVSFAEANAASPFKAEDYAARHKEHTGVDDEAIHRNLRWLDAHGAKVVLRCPMIPEVNDFPENLKAFGELADGLKSVAEINVEPYVAYDVEKAHKLGLNVYEAPSAPPEYADGIVRKFQLLTRKKVVKW